MLSAVLHGCRLRVVASRSPAVVGIEGLVVRESASAFHLITRGKSPRQVDPVKVLPKNGRRFAFELGGRTFVLHGNGLVQRNERVLGAGAGGGGGGGAGAAAADRRLLKTTRI